MKRLLRSFFTAAGLALGVQLVTVGVLSARLPEVVGGPEVEETRQLVIPPARKLYLTNNFGSVRIRSHELREVDIEADIRIYCRVPGKHEELASYAKSLIQVLPEGDCLRVVTEPEGRAPYGADVTVDYLIQVPAETDVAIKGINGNIWVAKGCGGVEIEGQNTDVEVSGPKGPVVAKSTNGRIRVTDAPAGATISTINGNVYAHMLGGALSAETINGAIVARVLDPRVDSCTLETQNGGITLVMHPECGAEVHAETLHGRVRCDMPIGGEPYPKRKRYLNATIGSGHTGVQINTLNGNIWIARDDR